ncbi:MAG: peptidase S41 [Lewinellaceae bacterium]|nr:peptidase S41 [Lewinellaceae bacterium]
MKQVLIFVLILFPFYTFGQVPSTLTPAEKVYGLSKFWQEVNYNFVYLNRVDQLKWDSAYLSLIDKVQKTENDYEYYRLMKQFCAILKDGHTNIEFPENIQSKLLKTMFGDYRIFIENIEHKAIITHINLSKKDIIPPGSEIVAVNNIPVKEYLAQFVSPYISSSTNHVLEDIATIEMLQGFEGEQYNLKIKKPDNVIIELVVKHSKCSETAIYPSKNPANNLLDLKWLDNQIVYLALNSFQDKSIDSLFIAKLPELYNAKALIVDLRNNGGGNGDYGLEILKYLIPNKKVNGSKSRTRNHIATYKAWGEMTNPKDTTNNAEYRKAYLSYIGEYYYDFSNAPRTLKTSHKRLKIPTVVLIGHNTASAAEDFLVYANKQPHFTKIGSPTFGSTGQPYYFSLPGGAQARVCTKQDTYPDGTEFVGVGIIPDIFVEQTLSDYLNNIDPVLERAIKFLNQKLE